MEHYDTLMSWLASAPRPLRMSFRKLSDAPAAPPPERMVIGIADANSARIMAPAKQLSQGVAAGSGYSQNPYGSAMTPQQQQLQHQQQAMPQAMPTYPGYHQQHPYGQPSPHSNCYAPQHTPTGYPRPSQQPQHSPLQQQGSSSARIGELPPPSARRYGKQTGKSPIAELGSIIGEKMGEFIKYQQQAAQQPYQQQGPPIGGAYPPRPAGYGVAPQPVPHQSSIASHVDNGSTCECQNRMEIRRPK